MDLPLGLPGLFETLILMALVGVPMLAVAIIVVLAVRTSRGIHRANDESSRKGTER